VEAERAKKIGGVTPAKGNSDWKMDWKLSFHLGRKK